MRFALLRPMLLLLAVLATSRCLAAEVQPVPSAPASSVGTAEQELNKASSHSFRLLNEDIPRGTSRTLSWSPAQSWAGLGLKTPVHIINGHQSGPVMCLTAAVHGDEVNGVEMVRRIVARVDPQKLSGVVIGIPIVNLHGFLRSSRYLPDRRDLNRFFPGRGGGSSASRIAHDLFVQIILRCTYLIDLHTGSFHRINLPQLRADLGLPATLRLARSFAGIAVLHHDGKEGTLRRAASDVGIAAVTLEAGGSIHLDEAAVKQGVSAIESALDGLGMTDHFKIFGPPPPEYYQSTWVRSEIGGIFFGKIELGDKVAKGDLLGIITDPITNQAIELRSPIAGRVLGMALNQVVMPGFAAIHLGQASEEPVTTGSTEDEEEDFDTGELLEDDPVP